MKLLKTVLTLIGLIALLPACHSGHQSSNVENSDTINQSEKDALVYIDDGKMLLKQDSIITLNKNEEEWLDPAISPDGRMVAYTRNVGSEDRAISLLTLTTKQSVPLKVSSPNFFGPMWAPDGAHIAFSVFNSKSTLKVGVINADNSGYAMLDSISEIDYNSPTWKGKDRIVAHNMEKLFTLDLQGKVVDSVSFEKLIGKDYSLSSSDIFFYSADGSRLFFNAANVNDNEEAPGLVGPLEALYVLNVADGAIKKLSPEGVTIDGFFITPDDRIFYQGLSKPFETPQLFEIDLNGNVTLLVKKGNSISVSSKTTRREL